MEWAALESLPVEERQVVSWRFDQFVRAGLDPTRAETFALNPDVDLEEFRHLIADGCDVELAVEIMA